MLMLALHLPAKGPNRGGALHICLLCNKPRCLRHKACCDEPCGKMCFLGCGVEAPENCDRCVRKKSRELAKLKEGGNKTIRVKRLYVITAGAAGINITVAREILKPSGLNEKCIRLGAGGGDAGALALKEAAVVFASAMERVSENGGGAAVRQCYVTKARVTVRSRTSRHRTMYTSALSAPDALEAIGALATKRQGEPMYGDQPNEALAAAAELFQEAMDDQTDALVAADLLKAHDRVNGIIVQRVRSRATHAHGWDRSAIEALEGCARDEAKKAIRRVLARSRAAVEARQANEGPKKRKTREGLVTSRAKVKKAKAKGAYKNPRTGDTKKHFKYKTTQRDRERRVREAYSKVERKGPGACTDLEVERHAEHKKHLEACAARNAARKGKK